MFVSNWFPPYSRCIQALSEILERSLSNLGNKWTSQVGGQLGKSEKMLIHKLTWHDADIWWTKVKVGLMVRNLSHVSFTSSLTYWKQLSTCCLNALQNSIFLASHSPTWHSWTHQNQVNLFQTWEMGPSDQNVNAASPEGRQTKGKKQERCLEGRGLLALIKNDGPAACWIH